MGSPSTENCSENRTINEMVYEDIRSKRPEFFPCSDCGCKFTVRAMQVHKRSCTETEGCECLVCKSGAKKVRKIKLENEDSFTVSSRDRVSTKSKSKMHVKPRLRDLLTGKMHNVKNVPVSKSDLITFKFVEGDTGIIDKMVADSKSAVSCDTFNFNEGAMINDHKYVSIPPQLSENAVSNLSDIGENSPDNLSQQVKESKFDHDGVPCNRKIFCCICDSHIYWESFGLHAVQHYDTLDDNNHWKCPACDKTISKPGMILMHVFVHVSHHPLDCRSCRCGYQKCNDERNRAIAEHCYAESSDFYCYICLNRFSHAQTLINHMRLHSKELPYTCTECNRSFRQVGNLQRHLTTHRGERPHKCNDCCRSFADPATLRNHVRVHTRETPYVCKFCSRGFTQVGNLKRHLALHMQKNASSPAFSSGIKMESDENKISIVGPPNDIKVNPSTESLKKNHVEEADSVLINSFQAPRKIKVNGERSRKKNEKMKVFTCEVCHKVYAWHHDLTVHFRTHTGEKPYKCKKCDKSFAQSGAVRIHNDRHHSKAVVKKKIS